MKKVFSAVLALVMAFSMTVCAFAAPSPTTTADGTILSATDANGADVRGYLVIDQNYTDPDAVTEIKNDPVSAAKELGLADAEELTGLSVWDVRWVGAGGPSFPLTIEIKVAGLKTTSKAHMLHYADGAWEEVTKSVNNGSITGVFNSLSPVAILVDKDTLSETSSDGASPKTYDGGVTAAAVIAMLALGGVVLVNRKKYEA